MQQRATGCGGASPAVVEGSYSCSHLCHLWLRSKIIASISCTNQKTAGTTYRGGQVQYRLACYESFLVVVFDLYIDNVHNAVEFTPACE